LTRLNSLFKNSEIFVAYRRKLLSWRGGWNFDSM